ncbi:hypothetical protein RclHR1_04340003 [Rhizophagus clarus]|uniref:CCHC-type domain-containing protein n=1 Tax=Rhizophagus clarus TaxID=94130 RepID=A0A2Z6RGG2_9GLOM|nr:hypothetical protein RclHR1_04340003 [Rhizophagus clarus]
MDSRHLYWSQESDRICNICGNPSHMAATCNNKNINKPPGKKPSRPTQQKRLDSNTQHGEEMDEDEPYFDQDPAIIRFKEIILNSLRQLETKIMNISSTLESTDKQIAAIVTAQKTLHIEKGSKLEGTMKKKSLTQSSSASAPDQAKKCAKSADDSDQEAEPIKIIKIFANLTLKFKPF